jgi:hypothetical protein
VKSILTFIFIFCFVNFARSEEIIKDHESSNNDLPVMKIQKAKNFIVDTEYDVAVYSNKIVIFNGKDDVKTKGEYIYKISDSQYDQLINLIKSTDFKKMDPKLTGKFFYAYNGVIDLDIDKTKTKHFFDRSKEFLFFINKVDEILSLKDLRCPYFVVISEHEPKRDICKQEQELDSLTLNSK